MPVGMIMTSPLSCGKSRCLHTCMHDFRAEKWFSCFAFHPWSPSGAPSVRSSHNLYRSQHTSTLTSLCKKPFPWPTCASFTNYVAGCTGVSVLDFMVATFAGLLPGTTVYVRECIHWMHGITASALKLRSTHQAPLSHANMWRALI